jgi:DNA helicase-2/ATP-dependent DNA helicase PcrA
MKLTTEQKLAVDCKATRSLTACPGSGKTRTIIAKILSCIDDVRGTSRRVACITYTNSAVHEIESRLRRSGNAEDSNYFEVSTIHTFCLHNILRPFHGLLPDLQAGFELAAPDGGRYLEIVEDIARRHKTPQWALEYFTSVHRNLDGSIARPDGISEEAAGELIQRLDAERIVAIGDIMYFSAKLAENFPFIPKSVASRFSWILVDEFQDTTDLQVFILKGIFKFGMTKLFLVGDPNQSIYGFTGANPMLMEAFARDIAAKTDITLSGNYRCSGAIVTVAERLCPLKPPMKAVGATRNFGVIPVHFNLASIEEAILGRFLPEVERLGISLGETAILAPQWPSLYALGQRLRRRGVPVVGPGARPYKRSLEFSSFAEVACAYAAEPNGEFAISTQRALSFLLISVTGKFDKGCYSYVGKTILCKILNAIVEEHTRSAIAIKWLAGVSAVVGDILKSAGYIDTAQAKKIVESADAMVLAIKKYVENYDAFTTSDLGVYAKPSHCLSLMTMHASKGREFDAVAVVDFHAGKVPHFKSVTDSQIAEARRLTYVALTRARNICVFITDKSDRRNEPSMFIGPGEMVIETL